MDSEPMAIDSLGMFALLLLAIVLTVIIAHVARKAIAKAS